MKAILLLVGALSAGAAGTAAVVLTAPHAPAFSATGPWDDRPGPDSARVGIDSDRTEIVAAGAVVAGEAENGAGAGGDEAGDGAVGIRHLAFGRPACPEPLADPRAQLRLFIGHDNADIDAVSVHAGELRCELRQRIQLDEEIGHGRAAAFARTCSSICKGWT